MLGALATVVPVVIRALGAVTPKLDWWLQQIPGTTSEISVQKSEYWEQLRSCRTLRPPVEDPSLKETTPPGVGHQGSFPLSSHLPTWENPEEFSGQLSDIVPLVWPPPGGTCPEHLTREVSRRHPNQKPEPPHQAPLDVEEQQLYSEPLLDD